MGLLDEILARAQYAPTAAAPWPEMAPPVDEAALAAAAREAAGARMALANRKRPPNPLTLAPDAQSAGIQLALDNAPAGTGVPFSTQAGMLAPPVTVAPPEDPAVPLPRARPAEADLPPGTPTDVSARARPLAAPPTVITPPAAAAPAPAAPAAAEPSLFGRLGGVTDMLGRNSNTLLALGAGFAGAPNIGQGISRAAAAAIPARAADIKQTLDLQSRGYGTKALIEAGVPTQLAIAAQGDADLKKALIKNYIEDRAKKIVEVGQDPNTGAKIFAQHDPFSGSLTAIDPAKMEGAPAAPASSADTEVTGPDYVQQLRETNPDRARRVESIIRGDEPLPTGRAALSPLGSSIIRDVYRAEPGTSEADFRVRRGVREDYSKGMSSRITKSLNTTVQHGAGLEKAIGDLHNYTFAPEITNSVTGAIQRQYDPKYQAARKSFISNMEPFVKELDFVLSGGRPTVSGQKELRQMFNINASPVENMASLHKAMDLLNGRLQSHAEGYNRGMRTNREGFDFIDPVNRGNFKRLLGQIDETPAPAEAAPPAAGGAVPKPGRYIYDPASGRLAPAQ